jgi:hypothetical protein
MNEIRENIERATSNNELPMNLRTQLTWKLGVGCWTLDVSSSHPDDSHE